MISVKLKSSVFVGVLFSFRHSLALTGLRGVVGRADLFKVTHQDPDNTNSQLNPQNSRRKAAVHGALGRSRRAKEGLDPSCEAARTEDVAFSRLIFQRHRPPDQDNGGDKQQ